MNWICPRTSRNVQELKRAAGPRYKMKACGSHLLLEKRMVAEILASLFLVLTFWKQINLRLSPELFQAQLVARGIRPIHPIQEWLAGLTTIAVRLM